MAKVALIIGHSKKSPGAVNKASGVNEYSFNSRLAPVIADILKACGVSVEVVERGRFYSLLPRKVNKTNADIAVSLHCNAFDGKEHGSETLHYEASAEGCDLAFEIQKEIVKCLGLPDRGVKPVGRKDRGGLLLQKTKMPCVIVEPFFIDCDESLMHADCMIEELAVAYTNGIINYLNMEGLHE